MAQDDEKTGQAQEPRGFGEHSRGLAGEYAHEQGWGLNADERTHQPNTPQNIDGGNDYDYGARDFGDDPVNTKLNAEKSDSVQQPAAQVGATQDGKATEARQRGATKSDLPALQPQTEELKKHGDELEAALK